MHPGSRALMVIMKRKNREENCKNKRKKHQRVTSAGNKDQLKTCLVCHLLKLEQQWFPTTRDALNSTQCTKLPPQLPVCNVHYGCENYHAQHLYTYAYWTIVPQSRQSSICLPTKQPFLFLI